MSYPYYTQADLDIVVAAIAAVSAALTSGSKEIIRMGKGDLIQEYTPTEKTLEMLEARRAKIAWEVAVASGQCRGRTYAGQGGRG